MLKLLMPTMMLIPMLLIIKPAFLFTSFITYTLIIASITSQYLNNPLNMKFHHMNALLGLDLISTPLLILSTWLLPLMAMASQYHLMNEPTTRKRSFLMAATLLQLALIMTFSTMNLMLFYIMFEATLIPTLILITRWGSQTERLNAGTYFMLYTLIGSLPLLIVLLTMYSKNYYMTTLMLPLVNLNLSLTWSNTMMWMACMLAFLVKMPLYGLHLWLPKAHVEAPIAGSMILAGVLLKLGGYGIIRLSPILTPMTKASALPFIILALWGMIMTSIICLRQTDLKSIIAYSSVSHMGLVTAATLIHTPWSILGAMIMMIAHGLTSSLLFCLANTNYERTHTRTLLITRGLQTMLPLMTTWWLLASLSNLALPPTINLFGELLIISALLNWSVFSLILTALTTLLTATYSLYIFVTTQRNKTSKQPMFQPSYTREHLLLTLHLIPLLLLILNPKMLFYT
uniref:NADH dehydrogenase subunit 4 n=1 Tax=Goniurosaurus bawanglingensis TaxID=2234022 RepID=UPI002A80240D|nr:NADH dehydrogenase subunit 4 [Goniurosaurus bawanglingensis]WOA02156.1 NADH dehydrogenase subunit 4 [Goniurosaurus bawanglingensis]